MNRVSGKSIKIVKRPRSALPAHVASKAGKVAALLRIKSILVPSDFSIESRKAFRCALSLAKRFGASVILLHVLPAKCTGLGRASDLALEDELRRGGSRRLNGLVEKLLEDEVPCRLLVRIGNPAAEIASVARTLKSDLIVTSMHGWTGLKHLLGVSVVENVLRHAPCPVLVVPNRQPQFREFQNYLAAETSSVIPKPGPGRHEDGFGILAQ
jgi:universal stress protein A